MSSRERERKKIYTHDEEKRFYLHGCFDSFGMLRFASRVVKESFTSSSRCVAQMFYSTPKKKEEKNTTFFARQCV